MPGKHSTPQPAATARKSITREQALAGAGATAATTGPDAALTRPARKRRTQEERSSETQQRLCQAAVDLLTEVGYERLTTAQIAMRAGVSKGAQAHHYPSKDDMLVAAFRHLLGQWDERREAYAQRHGDGTSMKALMEGMWKQVFGRPDYLASLEVMLAARHNPALRDRLQELLSAWTVGRDETFRQLIPLRDPDEVATFMHINFSVLRGLAVFEGLTRDASLPQRMLSMWTEMASAFVKAHSEPDRSRTSSNAATKK